MGGARCLQRVAYAFQGLFGDLAEKLQGEMDVLLFRPPYAAAKLSRRFFRRRKRRVPCFRRRGDGDEDAHGIGP
jgi:hypothetical protein